ncbi:MAG: hypothetical protein J6A15_02225 [Clostridia bacterium]|nr:hypothetical protein [Clostridia bacterium]
MDNRKIYSIVIIIAIVILVCIVIINKSDIFKPNVSDGENGRWSTEKFTFCW